MAYDVGLRAILEPEISDEKADEEVESLKNRLESIEDTDLELDNINLGDTEGVKGALSDAIEGGGGGGGGGLGGALEGALAGGAGGGAKGGGAGGLMGKMKGGASKLPKVALAGGVALGILKGVSAMKKSSPYLKKVLDMFSMAVGLFFRPFGRFIASVLEPFARGALLSMVRLNQLITEDGLLVGGLTWLSEALINLPIALSEALANGALAGLEDLTGLEFGELDLPRFRWGDFMDGVLSWGDYIPDINWPDWLSPLEWIDWLPDIGASTFLDAATWPDLDTSRFLSMPVWPDIGVPDFLGKPSWPDIGVPDFLGKPSWPDIGTSAFLGKPSWPDIGNTEILGMPVWPDIGVHSFLGMPVWPDIGVYSFLGQPDWPDIGAGDIVGSIKWPTIDASMIVDAVTPGGGGGGGGHSWYDPRGWGSASGSVVTGETMELVGEREEEAILPLSKLSGMLDRERETAMSATMRSPATAGDERVRNNTREVGTGEIENLLRKLIRAVERSGTDTFKIGNKEAAEAVDKGKARHQRSREVNR